MISESEDLTPEQAARRHLLLSLPEPDVPYAGHEAFDALLRGAIHARLGEAGRGQVVLIRDLLHTIQELTGLRYEPTEIKAGLERVSAAGLLVFRDEKHQSFVADDRLVRGLDAEIAAKEARDAGPGPSRRHAPFDPSLWLYNIQSVAQPCTT